MKRSTLPALIATIAAGLLLAGCGEDEESAAAPLPKAQFVKKANAICERERQKALTSQAPTEAKIIDEAILPAIRSSIDEVGELGVPQGDEKRVDAVLGGMQQAVAVTEERNVASVTDLEPLFAKSGSAARKYGIGDCAFG